MRNSSMQESKGHRLNLQSDVDIINQFIGIELVLVAGSPALELRLSKRYCKLLGSGVVLG